MSKQNIVTFIDHIGRTIIAEQHADSDKNKLVVKNPAIIHVQPTQQGQLNVQTIPLFFREFVSEKTRNDGTIWAFKRDNIVEGVQVDNEPRLIDQYNKLFSGQLADTANVAPTTEKVVKLFDE
jgi:hypothetical protein